ncbi:MAG: efflux RND transporter periplasmic adaptor subunit [Magnetococcales bacterium]|nr:efflux RND transporter periplasmic adaptor subunit [Magnetococcales bacterium]
MKRPTGWLLLLALALPAMAISEEKLAPPPDGMSRQEPELRAELLAKQFTTLSSEIGARLLQLPFREGAFFKAGERLGLFDCTVQQAKLERAQAIVQAETDKAALLGRLDRLNVTSKLELTNAKAETAKAQAELAIIRAELKGCELLAPFPGQVVRLEVQEHQYVKPGQVVMEIHNPSTLELVVHIPSRWMQHYHKDDRFLLRVDETGKSYPAKILAFGAKIDAVNQLVKMTGAIVGTFPELSPGMSGQVLLNFSR